MARSWDSTKDSQARASGDSLPNVDALGKAIAEQGQWSVEEVVSELGGTEHAKRHVAEQLLAARGMDISEKNIKSQMRSINRWIAYETGSGSQARKPSKQMQTFLNRIGRNAQMARDGFTVAMSGDIGVAGYRRSNRSAMVHMQGDAAAAWLENPTYAAMAAFYDGNDIAGYGSDLEVEII